MLALLACAAANAQPLVDHHQHLFSPEAVRLAPGFKPVFASELVPMLKSAGIGRAVVLSLAYQYGNPNKLPVENEYERVKAENDWTGEQVSKFPGTLIGFCSVNPLKDYALPEIARCAKDPHIRHGLKLHFGNSDVDLNGSEHVDKVRAVFRAANQHRMAIVVHMRSSVTRNRPYGAGPARTFLRELLPAAPDVTVQIAHLFGAGGYSDPSVDQAAEVFADAFAKKDARLARVRVDISGVVSGNWREKAELIVKRMREIGMDRLLFGSDGAIPGNLPDQAWARIRELPLTDAEFRMIERNVAPYLK